MSCTGLASSLTFRDRPATLRSALEPPDARCCLRCFRAARGQSPRAGQGVPRVRRCGRRLLRGSWAPLIRTVGVAGLRDLVVQVRKEDVSNNTIALNLKVQPIVWSTAEGCLFLDVIW